MNTTVPGGAYLRPDGKTWVNAKGKVIPAPSGPIYETAPEEYSKPEEPIVETEVVEAKKLKTKKAS